MRSTLQMLFLLAFTSTASAASPEPALVKKVVDRHIAGLNQQAAANREEAEAVQTVVADLDGDGKAEIVLLATLYGASYASSTVTVFADRGQGHVPAAKSDDALGQVEKIEVKDGRVLVHALWPGPNDPRCCPSQKRATPFVWQGSKLVEAKAGTSTTRASAPAVPPPAPSAAAAAGWQVRPVAGRAPVATAAGPGVVQSISLACNETIPVAAVVLKAKPPPGPVVLGLEAGGQRIELALTQPQGGGSLWYGDLRNSALPKFLLSHEGKARLTINRGSQGDLSLQSAGSAAKAALAGCYRF